MDKEVQIERLRCLYHDQRMIVEGAIKQAFGVPAEDIESSSRVRGIVEARMALFALFRKHFPIPLVHLGMLYNRHHATVLYGIRTAKDLCRFDVHYRDRYNRAEAIIEKFLNEVSVRQSEDSGEN